MEILKRSLSAGSLSQRVVSVLAQGDHSRYSQANEGRGGNARVRLATGSQINTDILFSNPSQSQQLQEPATRHFSVNHDKIGAQSVPGHSLLLLQPSAPPSSSLSPSPFQYETSLPLGERDRNCVCVCALARYPTEQIYRSFVSVASRCQKMASTMFNLTDSPSLPDSL